MKKLLTILLLLTYGICSGQNLVPNGDFETYSTCPDNYTEISRATPWFDIPSVDYFNSCTTNSNISVPNNILGNQFARSGNGYIGLLAFVPGGVINREYAIVELTASLDTNINYCVNFYVSLSDSSTYAISNIGLYISDSIPVPDWPFVLTNFTPQISNPVSNMLSGRTNWQQISGTYTAHGGERYIILGNFDTDENTNSQHLSGGSALYDCTYYYIDDVSLMDCTNTGVNERTGEEIISLYPNPFTDKLNIQTSNYQLSEIILYDLSSRKLLQQTFTNTTTINTEQLAKGMYLYTVRNRNGIIKNGKVIKQ